MLEPTYIKYTYIWEITFFSSGNNFCSERRRSRFARLGRTKITHINRHKIVSIHPVQFRLNVLCILVALLGASCVPCYTSIYGFHSVFFIDRENFARRRYIGTKKRHGFFRWCVVKNNENKIKNIDMDKQSNYNSEPKQNTTIINNTLIPPHQSFRNCKDDPQQFTLVRIYQFLSPVVPQ